MPAMLQIEQIPCLSDNYVYLVHEPEQGLTAVVDPAETAPVLAALKAHGWTLTHILNTHHHFDHVGGNLELQAATGCQIVGPAADRERIPGIALTVADGDTLTITRGPNAGTNRIKPALGAGGRKADRIRQGNFLSMMANGLVTKPKRACLRFLNSSSSGAKYRRKAYSTVNTATETMSNNSNHMRYGSYTAGTCSNIKLNKLPMIR
jgi:hypothetical protein